MFEGEIFEERGDLAEAERRYLAAVSLLPAGQSAHMALAHVRHARGARAEAAEDIRSTTREREVPDTADPWFWYARGTFWRGFKYLDEFLNGLTDETGGRVLFASSDRDLRSTFNQTLAEFRDRYVLSYTPAGVAPTGWHRLEVKLKRKSGKVTARRGYFAE